MDIGKSLDCAALRHYNRSMPQTESHPYSRLTPDLVLDAVDALGYRSDGRLLALNSYENRVFLVGLEEGPSLVAKFYRPGRWSEAALQEEQDFVAELAAADLPVVPPVAGADGRVLHQHAGFHFAVFPRQGGRAPELDRAGTLETLGRYLARLHLVGASKAYAARPTLDAVSFGEEPMAYLLAKGFLPPELEPAYRAVTTLALEGIRACQARAGDVAQLRLHGDCHVGNVLWVEAGGQEGPHFVDFDDSRKGPAMQDLWMLLSGSREEMCTQLGELVAGYELFREFDDRELHLVEALRTLRLIHYAGWLARRWDDPAFPAAFTWFNTQRYWEEHILQLREQVAAMQEAPLVPR
jgi:Ser/Thr protein kinase RdoA (MazF antagonist)